MNAPIQVRERGCPMVAAMVRATLEGRKTNTRRIVVGQSALADRYEQDKRNPLEWWARLRQSTIGAPIRCPYGKPGNILYVREAWRTGVALDTYNGTKIGELKPTGLERTWAPLIYEADGATRDHYALDSFGGAWGRLRAARFMPRWASRIDLLVTDVRVERLQEISDEDCRAEGLPLPESMRGTLNGAPATITIFDPRKAFAVLWDAINGARAPWASNPWAWRIAFERVR